MKVTLEDLKKPPSRELTQDEKVIAAMCVSLLWDMHESGFEYDDMLMPLYGALQAAQARRRKKE